MRVLQEPGAVRLPLGSEQVNGFVHPAIRGIPCCPEVLQRTQHVVVPAGRKREFEPRGVDDGSAALTPEQLPLEEVLFTRRRAAINCAEPPVARSWANRPSRTLIVVWKEERTEPFSASQFHPPSSSCSSSSRATTPSTG